jgi:hypothetical protein
MVSDHVEFTTTYFVVVPGEDDDTNPGIFGCALAEWVAQRLLARGVPVDRIASEDFGRCVIVKRQPIMLFVACASSDGNPARWQMFIGLEQNWLRRLFRSGDAQAELARLRAHFRAIVAEVPGISNVTWQRPG